MQFCTFIEQMNIDYGRLLQLQFLRVWISLSLCHFLGNSCCREAAAIVKGTKSMPQIILLLLIVGAGWILVTWFRMLYGSYKGFPRSAGMPLPIIGHSYKLLCPLEDLWPTLEKIIAKYVVL